MAKVGRPRNLDSPEQLYGLFEKYKANVKANPRIKYVYGGKDFEERAEPQPNEPNNPTHKPQ